MRLALKMVGILVVAGCTTTSDKEARCKCFGSNGQPTGACDFEPLPASTATFTFMSAASSEQLPRMSLLPVQNAQPEHCGE
jgi:hypothetical protein